MHKIIQDFKTKCDEWDKNEEIDIIFNKHLENINFEDVKYILIGDNPGKDEKEQNEYLIGDSGIVIRLFFENFLVKNFDKEVLVLNKTPIATNTTDDLKNIKAKKILKKSQLYIADLIYEISKINDMKIIIMGISSCRNRKGKWNLQSKSKTAYFCSFFKQIQYKFQKDEDKSKLFFIKHFSRNQFFKDFKINNYRNRPRKTFFEIGERYRDELFEK
ncbi:MAG: hypothetical protein KAH72_03980 [Flavobacteriaceae bacterium]|nr:hypothetical protein [Flavobacteriaceae bacterium]